MFVLDQCMKGRIDILPSPFNRWQNPIKWSTSLEKQNYYFKKQSSFGAILIGLWGFFSPALLICSLSPPQTAPACKAEVSGPSEFEGRSRSALIWGSEPEIPAADDTQGSASYSATSQQGHLLTICGL